MFGEAGVNDEDDAVDGERCFGNVGGHHDLSADGPVGLPTRRGLENSGMARKLHKYRVQSCLWCASHSPLLQIRREGGVERYALHVSRLGAQVVDLALDALARLLDLLLPRQEHQHVALLLLAHVDLRNNIDIVRSLIFPKSSRS